MSEKIYSWLLRLYPPHFRRTYGEEALQLVRDRSRDEHGFFAGLRLWLDLLLDLAVSLPRQRRHPPAAFAAASAAGPQFHVLPDERLRLPAVLFGSALSLAVFGACSYLIAHPGSAASLSLSLSTGLRDLPGAINPRGGGEAARHPAANLRLDSTERRRVVDAVITDLQKYYIDPAAAHKTADALRAHEQSGAYDTIPDGAAFADRLTRDVRNASRDLHLDVQYTEAGLLNAPRAIQQQNCFFEPVRVMPHNIGYLKLNGFAEPSVCRSTATAAMAALNQADAVIIDLRDNRGGFPGMVMLIAAYFFDHPEYMYNPREDTTARSWTRSPVPGSRLANKPLYLLTSGRTFSAAEHFSYNLKMLKRATLVGEKTAGAADVGTFHRIDDHFGMGIRETRSINPYSTPDWAVTGIEPDVSVAAAHALETAQSLALSRK